MAVRNQVPSGWRPPQELKLTEEYLETLATEYVQAAIETCKLYDVPLTQSLCDCVVTAAGEFLDIQFRYALKSQALGTLFGVPKIMNRIKVAVENARVADGKERKAMAKEKQPYGDTYMQNITQHGGVMNASQTGNVSAQQLTVVALDELRPALAEMRAFFKKQEESTDTDECVGLLASAEKAASEKDESKMLGYLKQIPAKAWEIGKVVLPPVLLHYLKAHGMAE